MFLTISYVSSASEKLTIEDIEMLMIDTKVNNNRNNIRGILVYIDRNFFQIIEGEYHKTMSLFQSIQRDNRHYNILKILETKSLHRKYKRFNSNYITSCSEEASYSLLKFLEISNEDIPDLRLHDLIVDQSKALLSMS
ncbi:BLUF domain-containing protein [Aquimarina aggregata]|uniref:BLUF domain-containing protein n=1 Tax=Aquimarina aggregata TaxID=1642818 RepID=UPI00248FA736|nr:BLUF domain-containing protein [Aquimarina aggregata]